MYTIHLSGKLGRRSPAVSVAEASPVFVCDNNYDEKEPREALFGTVPGIQRGSVLDQRYNDSYYSRSRHGRVGNTLGSMAAAVADGWLAANLTGSFGPGRLLEIGFGDGSFLARMKNHGWSVWGVDVSPAAVSLARERGIDAISVADPPYGFLPDGWFDLVVMRHTLEHVEDVEAVLDEVFRVLKPGGALFVSVPNAQGLEAALAGSDWFHSDHEHHRRSFTPDTLTAALAAAGLRSIRLKHAAPLEYRQSLTYDLLRRLGVAVSEERLEGAARLLFWLLLPPGVALSFLFSFLRRGGTVHATASKPLDEKPVLHVVDFCHENSLVMSGGERIAIELARRWSDRGLARVRVLGSNLTESLWGRYIGDSRIEFVRIIDLDENENLLFSYLKRVVHGLRFALSFKMDDRCENLLYSASDFWPDALTAFALYVRNRKLARWIAGFYLFAPNPLRGFSEAGGMRKPGLRNALYWISQKPVYHIVRRFADCVFVTSEPDVPAFLTDHRSGDRVVVVRGGVDLGDVVEGHGSGDGTAYDAVFVGRFHPQKGVLELVDIWKMVVDEIPDARLAVIGVGPLAEELETKISRSGVGDSIDLLGFVDGEEKNEIFRHSRLILHPALYDSGGMAAAEGMAWGLPGVAFDLPALRSYYPEGMKKAPIGDLAAYACCVVELLRDENARRKLGSEAAEMVRGMWDWDARAMSVWKQIESALMPEVCDS